MEIGIEKTCPKCGRKYTDHSAISRVDNTTPICPDCGVIEAMQSYYRACGKRLVATPLSVEPEEDPGMDSKFIAQTICYLSQFTEVDDEVPEIMRKAADALEQAAGMDEYSLGVIGCAFGYARKNNMEPGETLVTLSEWLRQLAGMDFVKWRAQMDE